MKSFDSSAIAMSIFNILIFPKEYVSDVFEVITRSQFMPSINYFKFINNI